jgi:hypothetical protein
LPVYTAEQLREVMAERDALRAEIQAMHRADDAYGAGFYNQGAWLTPYNKLRRMTAIDAASAQEPFGPSYRAGCE